MLAVDDPLWRRAGRKLHGTAWHHDGNGPARHRPAWGHRWVVVGIICHLPFLHRAMCLPILGSAVIPGQADRTLLVLARELLDLTVAHLGDRPVHLVGDAAYIGKPLRGLPTHVTVAARLRADAALHQPAPAPHRPARPSPGQRLPAARADRHRLHDPLPAEPVQVHCYGKILDREVLAIRCLWYGALGGQPVQVILSRPGGAPDGCELAWSPPPCRHRSHDHRTLRHPLVSRNHVPGRPPPGRRRPGPHPHPPLCGAPGPFGFCCLSLAIIWYARHGQPAHDLAAHRAPRPPRAWYRHKHTVLVADMLAALRRAVLAAQYRVSRWSSRPAHPQPIPRRPAHPARLRRITTKHDLLSHLGIIPCNWHDCVAQVYA